MTAHTPGPWTYDDDTATVDAFGGVSVLGVNVEFGEETTSANGTLAASAPELLEAISALRAVADRIHHPGLSRDEIIRALAPVMIESSRAIAKAKGVDR